MEPIRNNELPEKFEDAIPVKKWDEIVGVKGGIKNRGVGLTIIAQPIQSSNYVPNVSGWRIDSNGNADLNAVSVNMNGGTINMGGGSFTNVNQVSGNSGNIDFNEAGRIQISTYFDPPDAGTYNLGGADRYWAEVNTVEVVKRGGGGFGWFDEGVKLQDGRTVSDVEAIMQLRPHPTKKTWYGKPIIDMASIPSEVLNKPVDRFTKQPIPKVGDRYIETKEDGTEVEHFEGENTFVMMSILIGCVKELNLKIEALEERLAKLKKA